MPQWIPSGIGLQGVMSQISTSQPIGQQWLPPTDPNDPYRSIDLSAFGSIWSSFAKSPGDVAWLLNYLGGQLTGSSDRNSQPGRDQWFLLSRSRTARYAYAQGQNWNLQNPEVQQWVINGGALPSRTQSEQPPQPVETSALGGGTATTGGGTTTVSTSSPGSATVPNPFPYTQFADPDYRGYNYGDQAPPGSYRSGWHEGQDYGVANNTPITAPFGGKVRVGYDPSGYGSYVDLVFGDQGNYMRFAHLGYVNVHNGDEIQPGAQLGQSGSTGYSTGPHLLVELRNGRNQPLDPRPLLQAIFNNGRSQTFDALTKLGIGQLGVPDTGTNIEYTPDGKPLYAGTPDRAYYDMVNYVYQRRYGTAAPWSIVMGMRAAGVTNSSQMSAVAANWPSDIPGVSFGVRDSVYDIANGIAMKQWGRPIPDSLVKQLATHGATSPEEIKAWFMDHVPSDLPKGEYQQIYDAAAPPMTDHYGEGPSPEYVGALWGKMKGQTSGRDEAGGPGGQGPY